MPEDQSPPEPDVLHQFKNHLAIIVGFCDLLLAEIPDGDPRRGDIVEIHKAGHAAMDLLPALARENRGQA